MIVSKQLPTETARDYALRELKNNIISLELAPGTAVSENELAKELGISRTPVREALLELKKYSLVEVYPQKGCVISLINFDVVEEAVFLRRVLETAIVEELCETATDVQTMELEHNIQLQEFYLDKDNTAKILELDNNFHFSMFKMANKERIYTLMTNMLSNFDRIRTLSLFTFKEIKIVSDHRAILNAISAHDKAHARELIIKHLSRYKIERNDITSKYPEYFVKM